MGEVTGFLKWSREMPTRRDVPVRLLDWKEVYNDFPLDKVQTQAGRCMDCGIPFCNNGCPLGNLIPDWNDLVYRDHWRDAIERHRELTGSTVAQQILLGWITEAPHFRKVMPKDYRRVLAVLRDAERDGLSEGETMARVMEAAHG